MIGREQLERLWTQPARSGRAAARARWRSSASTVFAAVGARQLLSEPARARDALRRPQRRRTSAASAPRCREAGIAFDVNSEGTAVLVRYGQTAQARMLLAEKGLPSSANAGYELFDKLGSIGLTSFMQEITRVRALEGEIARTIQAMKGVKAARVHIVLPDSRLVPPQPPAAVGLGRHPHRVRRRLLVGRRPSAISWPPPCPGMTIDQVTVLNTDGTVLASGGEFANAAPGQDGEPREDRRHASCRTTSPRRSRPISASTTSRSASPRASTPTSGRPTRRPSTPNRASSARCASSRRRAAQQNSNSRAAVGVEQNVPGRAGRHAPPATSPSAPTSAARSSPTTR